MRVLVIEDDLIQQNVLTYLFKPLGINGVFCGSGEAGLLAIAQGGFDLLILDMKLPGISGLHVLKKLRENVKTKSLPIFVITADGSRETLQQCSVYGVSEYLLKPLAPELVTQKLRLYQQIVEIAKDASDKKSFSSVTIEEVPGILKFIFSGQLSRYTVQQFQNAFAPPIRARNPDSRIFFNLAAVPEFGIAQAEPLRLISQLVEPKLPLIIGGKNFGPLMPFIHNPQSRLFMNEGDALKMLKISPALPG
jgi:CheY-like chemotaxis protein